MLVPEPFYLPEGHVRHVSLNSDGVYAMYSKKALELLPFVAGPSLKRTNQTFVPMISIFIRLVDFKIIVDMFA